MANLKEVRNRIATVKSTQQITKAMKMVAASKLRKAQQKIQQMRPYSEKLSEILGNVSGSIEGSESEKYYTERESGKVLFVVVTADRGLCGGFNSNLFKALRTKLTSQYAEAFNKGEVEVYAIGKKGKEATERYGCNVIKSHDGFFNKFGWQDALTIADELMDLFVSGEYKEIHVVYNKFKNAAVYFSTFEQWLPIVGSSTESGDNMDYIFEPGKIELLDEMVPRSLRIALFKALLDSNAAEHGSRMTAMDSATENAQELLRSLSIEYNKARQAAITTEILEIVGGAEALANG